MKLSLLIAVPMVLAALACAGEAQAHAGRQAHSLQEMFRISRVCPVERGGTELEITPSTARSALEREDEVELGLAHGVTDRLFVELEWTGFARFRERGADAHAGSGDLALEGSFALLHRDNSAFHLAIGSSIQFPTGNADQGLGEGRIFYSPILVAARDFPRLGDLELFGELALSIPGARRGSFSDVDPNAPRELNVGVGVAFAKQSVGPTLEVEMTRELGAFSAPDHTRWYVVPGVFWRPQEKLLLGASGFLGLGSNDDERSLSVRLMYDL